MIAPLLFLVPFLMNQVVVMSRWTQIIMFYMVSKLKNINKNLKIHSLIGRSILPSLFTAVNNNKQHATSNSSDDTSPRHNFALDIGGIGFNISLESNSSPSGKLLLCYGCKEFRKEVIARETDSYIFVVDSSEYFERRLKTHRNLTLHGKAIPIDENK